MTKKVAILGVGPSGLAAAWAAQVSGWEVYLFSRDEKPSELHGCQYLHAPLPELRTPIHQTPVTSTLVGEVDDYRKKVYGNGWQGPVSPEKLTGTHEAWDLRATYAELWKNVGTKWPFYSYPVAPGVLAGDQERWRGSFDRVISTVPAKALCTRPGEHIFSSQKIFAKGHPVDEGHEYADDNHILHNGNPDTSWYRHGQVFGHVTTEWPGLRPKPPIEGVVQVEKPLWTNCGCFSWIDRLGRYGSWRKSVLVHDVFRQAKWLLANVSNGHAFTRTKEQMREICRKCGRIAHREMPILETGSTAYSCLSKHEWEVSLDGRVTETATTR